MMAVARRRTQRWVLRLRIRAGQPSCQAAMAAPTSPPLPWLWVGVCVALVGAAVGDMADMPQVSERA